MATTKRKDYTRANAARKSLLTILVPFLQMVTFRTFFQTCDSLSGMLTTSPRTFTCSPAVLHDRSNIIIHHQPRLFRRFATKHTPTFKTKTKTLLTVATCQWHMRCSSTYCLTGTAHVQDRHWITTIYIQYWVKTVYWWTLSTYSTSKSPWKVLWGALVSTHKITHVPLIYAAC